MRVDALSCTNPWRRLYPVQAGVTRTESEKLRKRQFGAAATGRSAAWWRRRLVGIRSVPGPLGLAHLALSPWEPGGAEGHPRYRSSSQYAGQMSGAAAVLFDVDGTLVASNYLHVVAWQRAFDAEDIAVAGWRIHRGIGMDGSRLVRTLSDDAPSDVQDRLSDGHSRYYRETVPLLAPLPGARALLRRVADLGLQVVLASSAPEDELETLRKVLDCDDVISKTTSSRDVDTAKPEPGIVQVALDRAGVDAEHAVFVGDAVWDAQAAAGAGGLKRSRLLMTVWLTPQRSGTPTIHRYSQIKSRSEVIRLQIATTAR